MSAAGAQGEAVDTERVAALAGQRVVVRYRLPEPDPATGATLTDAVGELGVAQDSVTVATRHGEVPIALSTIVAIKGIPPRPDRPGPPHRRLSVLDLELIKAPCWPARNVELLGDWRLRAHGGLTNRANSALAIGDPGLAIPAALDQVRDWYAARGLAPNLALTLEPGAAVADSPVGAAVLAAGWTEKVRSRCVTQSTSGALAAYEMDREVHGLRSEVVTHLSPEWLASFMGHRGGSAADARTLLTGSPEQFFSQIWDGDDLVGRGRLALNDNWASIAAVHVAPSHRHRGLAHAMMAALLEHARAQGAESVVLEYETDNEAAAALYATAAFVAHHDIVNLVLPQGV